MSRLFRCNPVEANVMSPRIEDHKRPQQAGEPPRPPEIDAFYLSLVTAMAEFAASLVHDLKQPITDAILNANACERWLRRDPPDASGAYEAASRMVADAIRAADIIDRVPLKLEALRQFSAKVTRQRSALTEADITAFKAAGYDNRAVLDVLVLAATKLISNRTSHLAGTPDDAIMEGAPRRRTR
jgi:alkylhydroperoxidase family enzyme